MKLRKRIWLPFVIYYYREMQGKKKYYVSYIFLKRNGCEATLGKHPLMSFLRKNKFLRAFQRHKMRLKWIWVTSGKNAHQTCQNQHTQQCWFLCGLGLWFPFECAWARPALCIGVPALNVNQGMSPKRQQMPDYWTKKCREERTGVWSPTEGWWDCLRVAHSP